MSGCLLLLSLLSGAAAVAASNSNDSTQLIIYADSIKTSDHAGFVKLLDRLDKNAESLSDSQKWYLRYLDAWELGYIGETSKAKPLLIAIIDQAPSETLKAHATGTLINILGIGHHYEEAFTRLDKALDDLSQITDKDARFHVLGEASQLLIEAGQYDLANAYADQIIADYPQGRNGCIGMYLKLHAEFLSERMQTLDPQFQRGVNMCVKVGENLNADSIRRDMANFAMQQGKITDAIALLENNYRDVESFQYLDLTSEYDTLLAQAYWRVNDSVRAERFALATVDIATKSEFTQPLSTAYELLYQIERQKGDLRAALAYHEKYMTADKGHVDDVREKALAYQFVKQQVEAKKIELDALNKQNQILQLQQALDLKAVETGRLYIALLLTILVSIALWLYRLKRSQLRFMRLARRDGLTGIFNRQHFVDEAEQSLRYAAKASRGGCLILIDLDHFKMINDTHGHIVGDHVLRRAVAVCQQHLHSCDVFGRIGGEEFGILLPECSLLQGLKRAERIRVAISDTSDDEFSNVKVSASFGIASTHQHGYDLRRLLVAADTALYRAKRDGRNRVVVEETHHAPTPTDSALSGKWPIHGSGASESSCIDPVQ